MGEDIAAFIAGLLIAGFVGLISCGKNEQAVKLDAVKAGAAEYYLDAEHNKQFRWRTNQ